MLSLERTTADGSGKAPVRRFQQGALDEVSFVGLDVGAIRAVLLAPQSGTWEVDEVNVSSSRSPASHRFVCRKRLGRGRRADADAVQLLPVPADVVMYGDTPLSPAQARTVREGNLQQYQVRKATQTVANGALVAAGSVLCLLGGGPAYAGSFAAGGLGGILYFALLARQVESITSAPLRMAEEPPGAATGALSSLGRFTESAGFRYLVLFAMLYAFFWGLQNSVAVDEAEDGTHVVQVRSRWCSPGHAEGGVVWCRCWRTQPGTLPWGSASQLGTPFAAPTVRPGPPGRGRVPAVQGGAAAGDAPARRGRRADEGACGRRQLRGPREVTGKKVKATRINQIPVPSDERVWMSAERPSGPCLSHPKPLALLGSPPRGLRPLCVSFSVYRRALLAGGSSSSPTRSLSCAE